jgi:hypothetical protein
MDFEETEARNDCVGEGLQQFNRPIEKSVWLGNPLWKWVRIPPPVIRKRRQKANTVPGGVTGPPCSGGMYIRAPGLPGRGSLESENVKYDHESCGTQTRE